jgi:hypothetical protein
MRISKFMNIIHSVLISSEDRRLNLSLCVGRHHTTKAYGRVNVQLNDSIYFTTYFSTKALK